MSQKNLGPNTARTARRDKHLWPRVLIGGSGLMVALVIVYWISLWRTFISPPKQYTTHADQISADLQAHGLRAVSVYVDQEKWDPTKSPTYGSKIAAYVPETSGSTPVPGLIECRVGKTDCWYQISALGVGPRDLPDLAVPGKEPAWKKIVRTVFARVGIPIEFR